jgi:spermidine synthase
VLAPKRLVVTRLIVIALLLLLGIWRGGNVKVLSIETQYNSVRIFNSLDPLTDRPVKVMAINLQSSSVMFHDSDELVLEYTKFFDLAEHFRPEFANCLMLGGAAYSYPKAFLVEYPEANIDVVEIDPTLTELAKEHFRLAESPRLSIYHLDARIFLNQTDKTYDVVFGDVFNSVFSIPFHLTTRECVQRIHDILNDDGIVVMNLVSAVEGDRGKFLRAEYATFKSVFPQVYLFLVDEPDDSAAVQNVIIVALKSESRPSFRNDDARLASLLDHLWEGHLTLDTPVLTDDHAPVDFYLGQAM